MSRSRTFLRRQRKKATFSDLGLNPDAPLPFNVNVQTLGQGTNYRSFPVDTSQQAPLMNSTGQFFFRFWIDDPNDPNIVI